MTEIPIPLLDLSTAAYQRLRLYPPFRTLVEEFYIGSDADDAASLDERVAKAWLFQGLDNEGRPFRDPEGSGRGVVVLSERRDWASANLHNTASFPSLQMLIYADSTRERDPESPNYGAPLIRDADRKCKHIFKMLDRRFHSPGNMTEDRRWTYIEKNPDGSNFLDPVTGTPRVSMVQVHSSLRGTPFVIGDVPGTNAFTVRGEATYNMITD